MLITLLKGVVYREDNEVLWSDLLNLQASVRDYMAQLGLDLNLDEAEGYAFLRTKVIDEAEAEESAKLPRLVARRPLPFALSLLLALLRKKLAEFDVSGGETRLVLSKEDVVEMVRVFLPESSNEARLIDQIETQLNKVVELGFLRKLKSNTAGIQHYEVRRILKAFVDAQWLADFEQRLAVYQQQLQNSQLLAEAGV